MNNRRSPRRTPGTFRIVVVALIAATLSSVSCRPPAPGEPVTHIAKGEFVVSLEPLALEGADADSKLGRMSIGKQITGDLTASSSGQMLSAMTSTEGSAGYVAIERVSGVLNGRRGTFVLQHTGTMTRGAPSLAVTVVPDSGTGELVGLEGEFEISVADGTHSYEFTYRLPEQEGS